MSDPAPNMSDNMIPFPAPRTLRGVSGGMMGAPLSTSDVELFPLSVHVVSRSRALCEGLSELARQGSTGPLQLTFSDPDEGMDPLLVPGVDAIVIDLGAGHSADLALLRRAVALGPDAPVLAVGHDDPILQMKAMQTGAEDCLVADLLAPRHIGLALRRAVQRRKTREAQPRPSITTTRKENTPAVTLVQESAEAIVILDTNGLVKFLNSAAEDMLGRKSAELIGKPFGLPCEPGESEVALTRPDGDNRLAEMRVVETRWGGVPARVAALNDVTVRRKLEETMAVARAQSNETKQRSQSFFSNVNHDLRTPLTHIIGFSELMKDEQLGPMGSARYRDYARDIHSSGTMLLDMIEDLLGIAEAETENINLTNEICNLAQLAEIAVTSQRQHASEEGVSLEIDCPARLPGLRGDARRLRQALFRLLTEAIHCARRGETLRLTLREQAGGIALMLHEVSHGGTQADLLPPTTTRNKEDPFVSAEDSGMAREDSLALSLTRKIVEMHGGKLSMADNAQGRGPLAITLQFPADRVIR
ncbi:MAG: histidine kinase dimerization/phospho-acceptor domain-containing protein [Parvibaculum sp.]